MSVMLIMLLVVLLVLAVVAYTMVPSMERKPEIAHLKKYWYAHRGFHKNGTDAPENSRKAFQLAVQNGYGIELDIQLSKDGQLVVFHDEDLLRGCGVKGNVCDYTYAELQKLSLFGSTATIPLFSEVLEIVDGKTPLIVEYKTTKENIPLCEAGNAMLSAYQGEYCIESFHPSVVTWYRNNRPDIIRGQLSCCSEGKLGLAGRAVEYLLSNCVTKPHFIAYDHNAKGNPGRLFCRNVCKNLSVAWTIKSQAELDANRNDFDIFIFEGFAPAGEAADF